MIRGTTPTHLFNIPFDTTAVDKVKITYSQNGKEVLAKKDCKLDGKTISVTLTQDDTFLFDHNKDVEIQIRVLTLGGDVLANVPIKVGVSKCLDDEVLV
jgi:hypothetical protein